MVLLNEEDYVGVEANIESYNRIIKLPSGDIIFFKGRAELLKHSEDLEFVRANPTVFRVVHGKLPGEPEEIAEDATGQDSDSGPERRVYSKEELAKLNKKQLADILKNLGSKKIPRLLRNKISLILEIQETNI